MVTEKSPELVIQYLFLNFQIKTFHLWSERSVEYLNNLLIFLIMHSSTVHTTRTREGEG